MNSGAEFLVGLVFFALFLAVLWAISSINGNVRKIREHLDAMQPRAPVSGAHLPVAPTQAFREKLEEQDATGTTPVAAPAAASPADTQPTPAEMREKFPVRRSVPATPRAPWEPEPGSSPAKRPPTGILKL